MDLLGTEIVHGVRKPGTTFSTADIEQELGVSRSVAREAVRVLESVGLVRTTQRVGCTIQPPDDWNTLAPQIIRWQMSGPERELQLRALTELRAGVEPRAAALAARRASWADITTLERTAEVMRDLGSRGLGDSQEFLQADVDFHACLLVATGNPAYAALRPTLMACLETRTEAGLTPPHPSAENLERHSGLARAIRDRDEAAAESLARLIVDRVAEEVE